MHKAKTRTSVTIDADTLAAAREFNLNVSAISESAVNDAVRAARAKAWHAENAESLDADRQRIEKHGTYLADIQVLKLP